VFLTVAEAGLLCLVLFGLFHWLGIFVKTRAILALLGAVSVGLGGFIGRLLGDLGGWVQHVTGIITAWAFGVSLSAIAFIVLAVLLIHDLHPRNSASARTGWAALATGIILAAGVSQIPALDPLANGLRSLLSDITGFINSL
jgi:hypothetical protein